jgi:hypothetical protein
MITYILLYSVLELLRVLVGITDAAARKRYGAKKNKYMLGDGKGITRMQAACCGPAKTALQVGRGNLRMCWYLREYEAGLHTVEPLGATLARLAS